MQTEPDAIDSLFLPRFVGPICTRPPLLGGMPDAVANTFPSSFDPFVGANDWPQSISLAPTNLLDLPTGFPEAGFRFYQGIVADDASIHGRFSVTNGLLVKIVD